MPGEEYALGHSDQELLRLDRQAEGLTTGTRVLLRAAGVTPGMTVLDLGTGTGRVAMLLAELVGSEGRVVAVDSSPVALDYARKQVSAAGLATTVEFVEADAAAPLPLRVPPADAVVARLVLPYQEDPVRVLRAWAGHVRPGGLVVAMEYDMTGGRAVPETDLVNSARDWIARAFDAVGQSQRLGPRLAALFDAAGLHEVAALGAQAYFQPGDPGGTGMIAGVVRSLLPVIVREGIATEEEVDVETLQRRLDDEVRRRDAVVCTPTLVGCWGRTA